MQELKKFFEEESKSTEVPKAKAKLQSDNLMDKMAEITKEIEKEKAEYDRKVEKHIANLKKDRNRKSRSRSRERRSRSRRSRSGSAKRRGERSTQSRGRSGDRERRTRDSKSRGGDEEETPRAEGDGKEDFPLAEPFEPLPDPNTKEGRAKLYKVRVCLFLTQSHLLCPDGA